MQPMNCVMLWNETIPNLSPWFKIVHALNRGATYLNNIETKLMYCIK